MASKIIYKFSNTTYADSTGKLILSCESLDFHRSFKSNVRLDFIIQIGKVGFMNEFGEIVIPCKYDFSTGIWNDDILKVESWGNAGYIDKNGTEYWED